MVTPFLISLNLSLVTINLVMHPDSSSNSTKCPGAMACWHCVDLTDAAKKPASNEAQLDYYSKYYSSFVV